MLRVTPPNGRIALASWTPGGFIGQMFRVVSKYVATPPGVASPLLWEPRNISHACSAHMSRRPLYRARLYLPLCLRGRDRLIRAVPELRARMLDEFVKTLRVFADALAERTGRRPDDPAVQTLAGAVIGVGIAVWYTATDHALPQDYITALDTGLDLLERGLRL